MTDLFDTGKGCKQVGNSVNPVTSVSRGALCELEL